MRAVNVHNKFIHPPDHNERTNSNTPSHLSWKVIINAEKNLLEPRTLFLQDLLTGIEEKPMPAIISYFMGEQALYGIIIEEELVKEGETTKPKKKEIFITEKNNIHALPQEKGPYYDKEVRINVSPRDYEEGCVIIIEAIPEESIRDKMKRLTPWVLLTLSLLVLAGTAINGWIIRRRRKRLFRIR